MEKEKIFHASLSANFEIRASKDEEMIERVPLLLAENMTKEIGVELNPWALVSFIAYLGLIIGIGVYSSRFSSEGITNYFIGGRRMNRLVVALSAVVSGRSSWLLLGFTGMAYTQGASALWAAVGYTVIEFFLFFFYAPRLRSFTEQYDCITLPDFFAARFNDRNGTLRILLVLVIIIFLGAYIAGQFLAGGKAFASSFGLPEWEGILITSLIVLGYTVLGGFMAVSLTDMVQAFFMIFALLILPLMAIIDFGGWGAVQKELNAFDASHMDLMAISTGGLIGFLGIGLGSTGNPHIISRYMSIDDPKKLKYSAYMGTVWNVLMAFGALMIGLVGRAYFPAEAMLPAQDPENVYPLLAQQQLPGIIFGLILASIFAAIMSTCDSQLLVLSAAVVRDVYQKILKKGEELPQREMVLISRVVVVSLVLLALLLGFLMKDVIFTVVLFAWAGVGGAIGPVSIMALFWKRTTHAGALAGMLTGMLVTLFWYNLPAIKSSIGPLPGWLDTLLYADLYELLPAFGLSILVSILVSLATERTEDSEDMFRVMKGEQD